jgi:hypothetical protein
MKILQLTDVAVPVLNIKMVANRWELNPENEQELLSHTYIVFKDNTEVLVEEDFEEVSSLLASI